MWSSRAGWPGCTFRRLRRLRMGVPPSSCCTAALTPRRACSRSVSSPSPTHGASLSSTQICRCQALPNGATPATYRTSLRSRAGWPRTSAWTPTACSSAATRPEAPCRCSCRTRWTSSLRPVLWKRVSGTCRSGRWTSGAAARWSSGTTTTRCSVSTGARTSTDEPSRPSAARARSSPLPGSPCPPPGARPRRSSGGIRRTARRSSGS
mmetsp:Transcript_16246/g.49048  ORF Transcript_16246/g.49048 Transcript_16246/m.49048 type:complete len:208 (+) Transcript_16246:172-795(+)